MRTMFFKMHLLNDTPFIFYTEQKGVGQEQDREREKERERIKSKMQRVAQKGLRCGS
jgi:hypothetical protein